MDQKRVELIEERKLWSICLICNGEYEDVRILPDCLHSFCFKCLSQTVATSNACPHCNMQIRMPILSLPINYAIQTWLSSSSLISNFELKLSNSIKKMCEECEDTNGEVYCKDCSHYYCLRCSKDVHSHRIMKTHNVGVISRSQYRTLNPSPPTIHYYKCEFHNDEEKRLYCEDCEEFVCVYCLDVNEAHCDHNTISIFKFIEFMKSKWQNNLLQEISQIQSKFPNHKEENIQRKITQINEEISKLQNDLLILQSKKEINQTKLEKLQSYKFHFEITNRFLQSFFQENHPLPLSSYCKRKEEKGGEVQSENIEMRKEEKMKRIADFFETKNIKKIYTSFLPPELNFNDENENAKNKSIKEENRMEKKGLKLTKHEIEKRNKMIISNKLTANKNLILSFGSEGKGDYKFQKVHYLSLNSKGDLIAVSDVSNNSIQTFGFDGILKNHYTTYTIGNKKFNFKRPSGIILLPKQNIIAVADQNEHQILMIDLTTSELKYAIGGGKGEMRDQLFQPRGIAVIKQLDLIAVCDCFNNRIQFFKLSSGDFYTSLSLNFRPYSIDLSRSAKRMVITDYDNHSVHLYSFLIDDQLHFYYRKIKEIGNQQLTPNPRGVALHPKANYFVVCVRKEILFYSLEDGDFLCRFAPSPYAHSRPLAVSVERTSHLFAVSDFFTSRVMLITSPIF